MSHEIPSRLLTAKEAAAYLRVHLRTIYEWVAKGMIPSVKLGRKRLFDRKALDRWIDSQAVPESDGRRNTYSRLKKWPRKR